MVLKQSNSLQEGPRCNPFAANGRGWSKGGCTHDSRGKPQGTAAQLCASSVPSLGWLSGTRTTCPSLGTPPVPTQQPSRSLARDAALPTTASDEAPLAPHQTKDQGSCRTAGSFPAPPVGLALWHVLFPSLEAGPCGPQHPGTTGPFTPHGGWGWFWDASLKGERTERLGGTE